MATTEAQAAEKPTGVILNRKYCLTLLRLVGCAVLCLPWLRVANAASRLVEVGAAPEPSLERIQFLSRSDGWAFSTQSLWRTSNGGRDWMRVALPQSLPEGAPKLSAPSALLDAGFDSADVGWVQMEQSSGGAAVEEIYRTQDGGKSWHEWGPLPLSDGVVFAKYFLAGGSTGWVAGARRPPSSRRITLMPGCIDPPDESVLDPEILHTVDRGQHWARQPLPRLGGCPVGSLYFENEREGFSASGHRIYYTSNGGATWQLSYFPRDCTDPEWVKGEWNEPVTFFLNDSKIGWASSLDGFLFKTTDGGKSWCSVEGPLEPTGVPLGEADFGALYFDATTHGWLLGTDERLYETDDGGSSWSALEGASGILSISCRAGDCWALSRQKLYRVQAGVH
jgi:photosystem II stability/assembly factor-like uncharacterized protein